MINVLVCDDDAISRNLARRVVTKGFSCRVFEASDGLEALDILQKENIDLLLIDLQMPLMGGLEVIRTMRASTSFASTPVVVFSASKETTVVMEAVQLHVEDFVGKPVDPEVLTARLTRLFKAISDKRASVRPRPPGGLPQDATALVVDGDAEYRQFVKDIIGQRCSVSEADSASRALRACLKSAPDVLFLGTDLGLLAPADLVAQVRSIRSRPIRIVAIPRKSDAEAVRNSGLYDDVLVRTYNPTRFEEEITRLLRPLVPFELLSDEIPDIRTRVLRAAEQVFGKMLTTDVEPVTPPVPPSEGPRAVAAVAVTTTNFIAHLRVRFDLASGRLLAGAFLQTDPASLADEDILSAAGELANVLGGRLHAAFEEQGLSSNIDLPSLGMEPAQTEPAEETASGLDLHFSAIDKPITFQIDLTVESTASQPDQPTVDEDDEVARPRADA